MCKENLESRGFVFNTEGERMVELESLEVKMSTVTKIENGEEKLDKYIGIVDFKIKEDIDFPYKFNIEAVINEGKETIYIKDCYECVKVADKQYKSKFDVKNAEIIKDKIEKK